MHLSVSNVRGRDLDYDYHYRSILVVERAWREHENLTCELCVTFLPQNAMREHPAAGAGPARVGRPEDEEASPAVGCGQRSGMESLEQ